MYKYVSKKEIRDIREYCEEIIKKLQKSELKEFFTFSFYLIGSGKTNLITINGDNGTYDLDYNLILQKDKADLFSKPQKIKELFSKEFDKERNNFNIKKIENSSSVITLKFKDKKVNVDIAILRKNNNGNYSKIIYDKNKNRYIWNEIKCSKNYQENINLIRQQMCWNEVRDRYLFKKNSYLRQNKNISSFSILLETINEVMQR